MSLSFRLSFRTALALLFFALLASSSPAQQTAPPSGELTVDRIYSQPSLSGRLTRGIAWSPDGSRLVYLESDSSAKDPKSTLFSFNPSTGERQPIISSDELASVLPAPAGKQSQATGLGRRAPSQIQWSPSGGAFLFQGETALGWFDLKSRKGHVLVDGKDPLADPKISPDGNFVSFLRDHNLWIVPVSGGDPRALTTGGTEELRKGELDWVYPEELDISTAYWWSPDSSSVAYLEMNESKVSQFSLLDFESFTGEAELQRYPVAGGTNPTVHVFVVPVSGGEPRRMDTGANDDIYLPRVNWLPDSRRLAIQRLNREQTQLDLLLADASTGQTSILLTEKDSYWINVNDDLRFFSGSPRFLWGSERSGYHHLYLYDLTGKQLAQLTTGEWEVTEVEALDEKNSVVYFSSTEKSPLERHLYRVGLDAKGLKRITSEPGSHSVFFSPGASFYLDTYSNSKTPPRQDVYKSDGTHSATLNENKIPELASLHLSPMEFLTVNSHDGVTLNCYMIKPPSFDPAKKYPVIVFTYGGPHAQVVLNAWGGSTYLWHAMMAQKGFIIFALDNRGSAGRGHLFEEPIHFRFGAQELSDQRDGAAWLARQPFVDSSRIGIWGWSYGGHMTLHAMLDAPGAFKVGFAGGPVTDWRYYDSIYTERYLGLPDKHPESYDSSSPIENASRLVGKLLIAHGTGDDNVHYSNTLALTNAFVESGKYAEVMAFPGRGHGVSDPPARRVLMQHAMLFFLNNL